MDTSLFTEWFSREKSPLGMKKTFSEAGKCLPQYIKALYQLGPGELRSGELVAVRVDRVLQNALHVLRYHLQFRISRQNINSNVETRALATQLEELPRPQQQKERERG